MVLDRVVAINPPAVRHVTYRGSVNLGVNVQDGNTQTKNGNLNADFEARSKRQRLTAGTAYNYSEQGGGITARNAKGRIKYDFFATDRLFVYSAVLLEADRFQDLNLRTAVSGGPGYQLIQAGDLEGDSLSSRFTARSVCHSSTRTFESRSTTATWPPGGPWSRTGH